jgi:hypothetical protein
MPGTLYISYFGGVSKEVAFSPISSETVSSSTTSAAGGTVPQGAGIASIYAAADHYVTIGSGSPTATATNGFFLPAGSTRDIAIPNGQGNALKIAAISLT